MKPCKSANSVFRQSQCPCCNECAARQVLSISSVTSCLVKIFSVANRVAELHKSPGKSNFGLDARGDADGVTAVGSDFSAVKFCHQNVSMTLVYFR